MKNVIQLLLSRAINVDADAAAFYGSRYLRGHPCDIRGRDRTHHNGADAEIDGHD